MTSNILGPHAILEVNLKLQPKAVEAISEAAQPDQKQYCYRPGAFGANIACEATKLLHIWEAVFEGPHMPFEAFMKPGFNHLKRF